jgi:hypothetical protein
MTGRAQDEYYVKRQLRARMEQSKAAVVLVGESTKHLHKFVRWELESALELGLPIIVANINNKTRMDPNLCPPIIRDACALHVPFKAAAIKHALETFPTDFRGYDAQTKASGPRYYDAPDWYKAMGL